MKNSWLEKPFKYSIGENINGWIIMDKFRGFRKGKRNNLISQKMYKIQINELIMIRREDTLTNRLKKPLKFIKSSLNSQDAGCNRLLRSYKYHAKNRNLTWNLTKEQFKLITGNKCYYCNKSPENKSYSSNKKQIPYIYNGIDRLNNKADYTIDNCVSCCGLCNQAKMDLSLEEFKIWIKRLLQHFPL